jgi:hypothetical protein
MDRKRRGMTDEPDDFKHPKCYANMRGGCSTKISGAHYVSHGLIKLYGNNDPAYTIQHRTGKGVGHPVRPKNFKANILCQVGQLATTGENLHSSSVRHCRKCFASFLLVLCWVRVAGPSQEIGTKRSRMRSGI